ncbi:shikimate dehydrogenase [soil metagenome]
MNDVYSLDDLHHWEGCGGAALDPPARLAVLGHPVAHSRSPQLHNPALAACHLGMQYIRIDVPEGAVPEALARIRALGFVGTNVTVPHKFAAMEAMDFVDPAARRLGAVNTVVFEGDQMLGFNTDGPGFVRAVREEFAVDVGDLRVLVLGAGGGAGRAVAVQCAAEGCERLVLANRTIEKAEALAAELLPAFVGDRLLGPSERLAAIGMAPAALRLEIGEIDLVVNATSIGMKRTDPDLLPESFLQAHHLVYDMIYSPPRTRLVAAATAAGARAANGLSMLVHQGAISFEHWFDRPAPLAVMRRGARDSPA